MNSTYLALYVERVHFTSNENPPKNPFIRISVYNAKKQLIEPPQDIPRSSFYRPAQLFWGSTWYMQTPLEQLSQGCYIILAFLNLLSPDSQPKDKKKSSKEYEEIAWAVIRLHLPRLTSRVENSQMYFPPISYDLHALNPHDMFISTEIILTREKEILELNQNGRAQTRNISVLMRGA